MSRPESDPAAERQRRRFARWSIVWMGVPWALAIATHRTYDALGWHWADGEFARRLLLHGLVALPFGVLCGALWARGMWAFGFGRVLPEDDESDGAA